MSAAGKMVSGAGLGLDAWGPEHDSSRFSLGFGKIQLAAGNLALFWRHEVLVAPVEDGCDGIAFALQADAWSRTYRSRLVAQNAAGVAVSAEGATLLTETESRSQITLSPSEGPPFSALDANLNAIANRYGDRTAEFVAAQLEYAWPNEAN